MNARHRALIVKALREVADRLEAGEDAIHGVMFYAQGPDEDEPFHTAHEARAKAEEHLEDGAEEEEWPVFIEETQWGVRIPIEGAEVVGKTEEDKGVVLTEYDLCPFWGQSKTGEKSDHGVDG